MSGDASPDGLQLNARPRIARMGKWPIYAVLAALLLLGGVLVYSVNFAHNQEEKEEAKEAAVREEDKPLWLVEGSGLALNPNKDKTSGVLAPERPPQEPVVIIQRDTEKQKQIDEEAENIRRTRAKAYMSALASPLLAKRENRGGSTAAQAARDGEKGRREAAYPASASQDPYDPAADRDKEAFFSERANRDTSWTLAEQRTAGMPLELKTGAVVPGVMLTGLNSDLPGNMIAQVSQNVFDTATGRNLLIPQGARLYGVYDSRVVYGQQRVLIAWNRIIFPDGSAMSIGAMPGADMAGMAGLTDKVDNHYLRIFGSAVMMSLVTGGMAYAMDSANNNSSGENGTSMQDEMTSALAAQLGQTTTTLLQKNLNIKPTLEIRPGYQFNIVLTKDLVFREPYARWRR